MALFPRLRAIGAGVGKIISVVERIRSATFATGGAITLPGATPDEPAQTVQIPTGILRDHSNQSAAIAALCGLAAAFGLDLPFGWTVADAQAAYAAGATLFAFVAAIFRTKSAVQTRG